MLKLLKADLFSLRKSAYFWAIMGVMVILAVIIFLGNYSVICDTCVNCLGCTNQLGQSFFGFNVINCFLVPILACLTIGSDYNDGIIKNKIILGLSRSKIYFANLIRNMIIGLIYSGIYIGVVSLLGYFTQEGIGLSSHDLGIAMFASLMLLIALISIYTLIASLIPKKSAALTIAITVSLLLFMINGNISWYATSTSGFMQQVFVFLDKLLPFNQAYTLFTLSLTLEEGGVVSFNNLWIYSLGLSIVFIIGGLNIFRWKNIK